LIESKRLSAEQAKQLQDLYQNLNPADLKRKIDKKLAALYGVYQKKLKKSITINPYKKQDPSMVTFFAREQPAFRLPV